MFDPYHKWLGILPKDQPPNHYRLLAVEMFEGDLDVIEGAAEQRMSFIRQYQSGENSAAAARILNELATARLCLLKPATKTAYDEKLRQSQRAPESEPATLDLPFSVSDQEVGRKTSKKVERRAHTQSAKLSQLAWVGAATAGIVGLIVVAIFLKGGSKQPQGKPAEFTRITSVAPGKPAHVDAVATSGVSTSPSIPVSVLDPNSPTDSKKETVTSIQWDFNSPRPAAIKDVGNATSDKLQAVPDGLRCIHPAKFDQGYETVGVQWKGEVIGDFEITVNYCNFQSNPVLTDWRVPRVDLNLSIFAASETKTPVQEFGIAHRRDVDGSFQIVGTLATFQPDTPAVYATNGIKVEPSESGRLRVIRQDATLTFLAIATESEDWKMIGTLNVDPGPVRSIKFGLRCEDAEGSAEVVLTEIAILATEIRNR